MWSITMGHQRVLLCCFKPLGGWWGEIRAMVLILQVPCGASSSPGRIAFYQGGVGTALSQVS
jgi:hypothetical protein